MDNNDNNRGFSGLSELASDISGAADVSSSKPSSPPHKPSQPALKPTASNETKRKASGSSQPIETVGSGKSYRSSGWKRILLNNAAMNVVLKGAGSSRWKWLLGIIVLIVVIWLANDGGQNTKKPSYKPPSPRSYNNRSNLSVLVQEIESGKAQAKQMEIQIKDMDERLEDYERKMMYYRTSGMTYEHNMLISPFNLLVSERNDLYEEYSRLINEVNSKVKRYNSGYR